MWAFSFNILVREKSSRADVESNSVRTEVGERGRTARRRRKLFLCGLSPGSLKSPGLSSSSPSPSTGLANVFIVEGGRATGTATRVIAARVEEGKSGEEEEEEEEATPVPIAGSEEEEEGGGTTMLRRSKSGSREPSARGGDR